MVDFRYHLVSIIAIFLALALGVVVGTTYLNGQFVDGLEASIQDLTGDKRELEATVGDQRALLASDDQAVQALTPDAVDGWLAGQGVALLSAPDVAPGLRDELVPVLQDAGASAVLQVDLQPQLLDAQRGPAIDELVQRVAPGQPGGTPLERGAALLAAAVVRPPSGTPTGTGMSDTQAATVLDGLRDLDLADAGPLPEVRPTLAVVLTGVPESNDPPAAAAPPDPGLLRVVQALDDAAQGVVVAGPRAAADGPGVLRALREDGRLADRVSSVDSADRPLGRVAVVAALREQASGEAGQYGTGAGNQGPLPTPSPS